MDACANEVSPPDQPTMDSAPAPSAAFVIHRNDIDMDTTARDKLLATINLRQSWHLKAGQLGSELMRAFPKLNWHITVLASIPLSRLVLEVSTYSSTGTLVATRTSDGGDVEAVILSISSQSTFM